MRNPRLRAVVRSVLAALFVVGGGTLGYMLIEGRGLLDSLYMTAITVTTIGYREVFPLSVGGRVFTIMVAFAGIGVILLVATEVGRVVIEGDLRRLIGLRRDESMIRKLSGHIVVCGHGRMGRAVVEVLREQKVPFVVVEADAEKCTRLEDDRVPVVQGDATKEETLRAARVTEAKTFLACLADDAHNVFAILLARQLSPRITVIARAVEEGSEERLRLAGADKVTNPYRLGGMRLAFTAIKPTVMDFIEASLPGTAGKLELSEIEVCERSKLASKTLAGAEVRKKFGVIVVALQRGETGTFNPGPDTRIEAGDVLVVLGPIEDIEKMSWACSN